MDRTDLQRLSKEEFQDLMAYLTRQTVPAPQAPRRE